VPFPQPGFVLEGDPIPARQGDFVSATLGPPKKMAMICGLTEDLATHSAEAAEILIRALMIEATAQALDAAFFSNAAASASRPAGVLAGVTPITGSPGGGTAALLADLRAMIGAITLNGGGNRIWLFADPAELVAISMLSPSGTIAGVEALVPCPVLAAGQIVALEVGAIASAFSAVPDVEISREATIHFDTAPAQIGTAGSPATVAAPTRSLWQTASLALRLILRTAWVVRAPNMVQTVNPVSW
jgi:hypothetical protein